MYHTLQYKGPPCCQGSPRSRTGGHLHRQTPVPLQIPFHLPRVRGNGDVNTGPRQMTFDRPAVMPCAYVYVCPPLVEQHAACELRCVHQGAPFTRLQRRIPWKVRPQPQLLLDVAFSCAWVYGPKLRFHSPYNYTRDEEGRCVCIIYGIYIYGRSVYV